MLRADFEEQITNLDTERLGVGDAVVLRLGPSLGPSTSENGMVVRVHEGEEERVDVAMHDADVMEQCSSIRTFHAGRSVDPNITSAMTPVGLRRRLK